MKGIEMNSCVCGELKLTYQYFCDKCSKTLHVKGVDMQKWACDNPKSVGFSVDKSNNTTCMCGKPKNEHQPWCDGCLTLELKKAEERLEERSCNKCGSVTPNSKILCKVCEESKESLYVSGDMACTYCKKQIAIKESFSSDGTLCCKDCYDKKNSSKVNHPQHYGGGNNPYEVIVVLERWGLDKSFNLGNAIKYIARSGKKNDGSTNLIQDLKKAAWYIERELRNALIKDYLKNAGWDSEEAFERDVKFLDCVKSWGCENPTLYKDTLYKIIKEKKNG
jgi:hypothetical protein